MSAAPESFEILAYNTATESENRIHDDTVAKEYGFSGGLVPGVDVYAYATGAAVRHFGPDWVRRGWANVRLLKPVYDGDTVTVESGLGEADALDVAVLARGETCAAMTARLPETAPGPPSLDEFPLGAGLEEKPDAAPDSLPAGAILAPHRQFADPRAAFLALDDVRETLPVYAEAGWQHPGKLLRQGNFLLKANVALGPWIHVESTIQNHEPAPVESGLETRGRVLDNYERGGHKFVEVDALVLGGQHTPLLRIHHVAIYQPRRRQAA